MDNIAIFLGASIIAVLLAILVWRAVDLMKHSRRTRRVGAIAEKDPQGLLRLNYLDEINVRLTIASGDPVNGVSFRHISTTSLFETQVSLLVRNASDHAIKISHVTWDVWIEGLHIKCGDTKLGLGFPAHSGDQLILLKEVLKESEASDLSWANQKPKPSCMVEGTLFYSCAYGVSKKNFSFLGISYRIEKDNSHLSTQDFMKDAYLDGLTGLLQRKFIEDNFQVIINRNISFDPISLIMMDIDNFKEINDTLGHQAGDEALRIVADCVKAVADNRGFCVRYGGDEFCVILENCGTPEAEQLAEQMLREINVSGVIIGDKRVDIGMSIGIATTTSRSDYKVLIKRADDMLLHSKKTGKNRISVDQRREAD